MTVPHMYILGIVYLKTLHNENLLLTDAKILKIVPDGLRGSEGFILAGVMPWLVRGSGKHQ